MMIVSDNGGAVGIHDVDDIEQARLADWYARKIGEILVKNYPGVVWHVRVNIPMGKAGLTIPAVSKKFGLSVLLSRDIFSLEQVIKASGGEMLERFNISRTTGDISHLAGRRNIAGELRTAAKGEL